MPEILFDLEEIPPDLLEFFEPAQPETPDWRQLNSQPSPELHFATFSEKLVEPCLLAGTSEWGACRDCGAPWKRETQQNRGWDEQGNCRGCGAPRSKHKQGPKSSMRPQISIGNNGSSTMEEDGAVPCGSHLTTGWAKSCQCETDEVQPCVVLDPFAGSGTVGKVATKLGRRSILIELSPTYAGIIHKRNAQLGLMI